MIIIAANNGHINVVNFLIEFSQRRQLIVPEDNVFGSDEDMVDLLANAAGCAAINGHMNIIKELVEKYLLTNDSIFENGVKKLSLRNFTRIMTFPHSECIKEKIKNLLIEYMD